MRNRVSSIRGKIHLNTLMLVLIDLCLLGEMVDSGKYLERLPHNGKRFPVLDLNFLSPQGSSEGTYFRCVYSQNVVPFMVCSVVANSRDTYFGSSGSSKYHQSS